MEFFDMYMSRAADWAYSMEISTELPQEGKLELPFSVENSTKTLIFTASTSDDIHLPWPLGLDTDLVDPKGRRFNEAVDDASLFVQLKYKQPSLVVLIEPHAGNWHLKLSSDGHFPFAVNMAAYKDLSATQAAKAAVGGPGQPPLKCRACKATAKALALAIVAAATLSAIPSALVSAVAAYMGVGAVVAAAFIASVLGDTASLIAEKLCKAVGLC